MVGSVVDRVMRSDHSRLGEHEATASSKGDLPARAAFQL